MPSPNTVSIYCQTLRKADHSRVLLVVVADPALQLLVLPRHELLAGQVGVVGVVLRRVVAALGCKVNTQ